jgi:hypothetical protein
MAIYAIYSPPLVGDPATAFDRARIVKMGFSVAGFVFGPLWLIARGLWIALGAWIVFAAIVGFLHAFGVIGSGGVQALYALSALLIGFEGREWRGASLATSDRPLIDVVRAGSADEAAFAFLARAQIAPGASLSRPATAAARAFPSIIGLFPEARR